MKKHSVKSLIIFISLGLLFALVEGFLVWWAAKPTDVHYHANIAIFINDKKVDLNASKYMEETTQCAIDPSKQRPEDRTHFHENNGDLVHVHAAGVTWGHLMANIGWNFGKDYIVDDQGKVYLNSLTGGMHFILNGKKVSNPFNRLITSEDRLLVYYGNLSDDALIKTTFPKVASTAHAANEEDDPLSCGGTTSLLERIFHTH